MLNYFKYLENGFWRICIILTIIAIHLLLVAALVRSNIDSTLTNRYVLTSSSMQLVSIQIVNEVVKGASSGDINSTIATEEATRPNIAVASQTSSTHKLNIEASNNISQIDSGAKFTSSGILKIQPIPEPEAPLAAFIPAATEIASDFREACKINEKGKDNSVSDHCHKSHQKISVD